MHLVGLLSSYFAHDARSQEPKAYSSTFPFATTPTVNAVLVNAQQYTVLLNRCPLALLQQSTAVAPFIPLLLLACSVCDGSVGIETGLPDREVPTPPPFGGNVHPAERSGQHVACTNCHDSSAVSVLSTECPCVFCESGKMGSSQQLLTDTTYADLSLALRRTRSCFMHDLNLCPLLGLN